MNKISSISESIEPYESKRKRVASQIGRFLEQNFIEEKIIEAVTFPQFAEVYKNKLSRIHDHRALATLGDALLSAVIVNQFYSPTSTKKTLTKEKERLANNERLQKIGKQWFEAKDLLFWCNNDLESNICYATLVEAIIGALLLSSGYDTCVDFVQKKIINISCDSIPH